MKARHEQKTEKNKRPTINILHFVWFCGFEVQRKKLLNVSEGK